MKRTLSRPAALLSLLPVFLLCLAPLHARAAGAADVANGYAGEAMAKILANWAAPADRGKVRIVVRVDAEGKVERCGYLEKSASQALNDSVCSAVMKTADLGKPPYGMSQDVYLTFWQGGMADRPQGLRGRRACRCCRAGGQERARHAGQQARHPDHAAESPGRLRPRPRGLFPQAGQGAARCHLHPRGTGQRYLLCHGAPGAGRHGEDPQSQPPAEQRQRAA